MIHQNEAKNLRRTIESSFQKRQLQNALMVFVLILAGVIATIPLLSVFSYLVAKGLPSLSWSFFTELPRPVGEVGGGMANAVVGTAILVALASFVGIPLGIATGITLSEYSTRPFAQWIRFSVDTLASVPSIVVGLFVYALLVVPMQRFSAHAGGLALAILMIPTIARTTEEILKLVPNHLREAGLSLGLPRWKVILRLVVMGNLAPLGTGVILALARVAGETAPLLFTAFGNQFWHQGLDQPISSLPVQIYAFAVSPYEDWHRQAWAGAFVLVVWIALLNIFTRWLLGRYGVSKR